MCIWESQQSWGVHGQGYLYQGAGDGQLQLHP